MHGRRGVEPEPAGRGSAGGLPGTGFGTFLRATMDEATTSGGVVISMKKDWKRIFAFGEEAVTPGGGPEE